MKKSRFTESQIVVVLTEGETDMSVAEVCRKHGIINATYYNWKSKYAGVQISKLHRLRELESENAKLKNEFPIANVNRWIWLIRSTIAGHWILCTIYCSVKKTFRTLNVIDEANRECLWLSISGRQFHRLV